MAEPNIYLNDPEDIDLNDSTKITLQPCKQYDDISLNFNIFYDGVALDLSLYTIDLRVLKTDNTFVIQDTNMTISVNNIKIECIKDITRASGKAKCELRFVNNLSKQKTSFDFIIPIKSSVISDGVLSGNIVTATEELNTSIDIGKALNTDIESNIDIATPLNADLELNIGTGNILNTDLENTTSIANTSKTNLETTTTNANNKKTELEGVISTANTSKTNLENVTVTANAKKEELDTSVANAQDDINAINAKGNDAFTILSTNWIGTEPNLTYTLNHALNSQNLIVGVIDSDTKKSIFPDFKYIDMNNIELQSTIKQNITVAINANYYSGKDANTVAQEVIDARGGKTNLKTRLDGVDEQLADMEQQKATKSEVEVERQRINSFTTLAQGSTTGDAELIDARIGADGITYPNTGGAIRGQINNLNKSVGENSIALLPRYNAAISSTNVWTTNINGNTKCVLIPVIGGESVSITQQTDITCHIAFLTGGDITDGIVPSFCSAYETRNVIPVNTVYTAIVPSDCRYIYLLVLNSWSDYIPVTFTVDGYDIIKSLISNIKENIDDIKSLKETTDIIPSVIKKIGTVKKTKLNATVENGAINGNVGSAISVESQTYWEHVKVSAKEGEIYYATVLKSANASVSAYVYFVNESNIIIAKAESGVSTEIVTDIEINVPNGATGFYVVSYSANSHVLAVYGIYDLQSQIDDISDDYPSYYDTDDYLKTKIDTINENAPLHGITFGFITDLHFGYNQLHSLALLKEVRKRTPMNTIVSGGDYVVAYGNESDIKYSADITMKYAKELYPDWFSIRGNHDFTIKTSQSEVTGHTWNDAKCKTVLVKPCADWRYEVPKPNVNFIDETHNIHANHCFVLTNEVEKVKIVCIADFNATNMSASYYGTTGYISNEYCKYVAQLLKSCDGYTVVVVTHAPITTQLTGGQNTHIVNVVNGFANRTNVTWAGFTEDFAESTGLLACCISGHSHADQSVVADNVLHINTTCDAYYNNDVNTTRTVDTITEQAFDVFNLDTENKTIKITRIGGGSDRGFNY